MGQIDNLNQSEQRKLIGRQKVTDVAVPLGKSAVSTPGNSTRFIGNESLKVLGSQLVSGWLIVTGTLKLVGALVVEGITTISGALSITGPNTSITGPFHVSGNTDISGNFEITGPSTTITGPFHVEGNTDIQGNLEIHGPSTRIIGPFHVEGDQDNTGALWIRGITSLSNDLRVLSGGKITAGGTTISPTGNIQSAGTIHLDAAAQVIVDRMFTVGGLASFANTVTMAGSATIASDLTMGGDFRVNSGWVLNAAIGGTTSPVNMRVSDSGVYQRVTSAARYKIDAQEMEVPDALLDVPLKDWVDLSAAESISALLNAPRPLNLVEQAVWDDATFKRVPGVIAEEVAAAGGEQFVEYGNDGTVQGVAYDRLALARTEIGARRQAASDIRISKLELELASAVAALDEMRRLLAA